MTHDSRPPKQFLVDENLPRGLAGQLRVAGYSAEHILDLGMRGYPDPAVFAYAQQAQRTIITTDLGFGNPYHYPPPHAGVIITRLPATVVIERRLAIIESVLTAFADRPFASAVVIIEIGRVRVREWR